MCFSNRRIIVALVAANLFVVLCSSAPGQATSPEIMPTSEGAAMAAGASPLRYSPPGQVAGGPSVAWGGPGVNGAGTAGPIVDASINSGSVFLGNGASRVHTLDFDLPLSGIDWFHERIYSSLYSGASTWQGHKWWGNEMMKLTLTCGSPPCTDGASHVAVEMSPFHTLAFTYSSGWTCDDKYLYKLTFTSGSDEYTLERIDGIKYVFHDQDATNSGKLKRIEDAYGNEWAFTYAAGKLTDIVIDVGAGTDHKVTYSYFSGGDNDNQLQYIKVYKSTSVSGANLIGQVEYVYHDSGTDTYGILNDLMKVIVSRKATTDGDGTLSIEETYRYRYYKGAYDGSTNPGTDHQLRYVLFPENADRLGSPESKSNAQWEDYTNVWYEYDSSGRVKKTKERMPGTSCGCGGGGGTPTTTTYTWSVNGSSTDADTWKLHCVADRQDDTRVIFDVTRLYHILTWVVQNEDDGSPTKELIWHFDYGTSGTSEARLTAVYLPSVCTAYDESSPYGVTLDDDSGVAYGIEYDSSSYVGYPKRIWVQLGSHDLPDPPEEGSPDTLIAYGRSEDTRPDLATTVTNYEAAAEADGRSTTLAYTFYDSGGAKKQIKEIDVTHPSVSTGKNGPNVSAADEHFFDLRTGALRWTINGEKYVNFYAYDDETGVENLTIIDVNTSSISGSLVDTYWDGIAHGGLGGDDTVPFSRSGAGTALNIDSSSVVDWLGRTRKSTDAGGMVTYTVYKDDELRVYPAIAATSCTMTLPYRITKYDKDGRPEDELEIKTSLTPSCTADEPTGTESYANSNLVSRTVTAYNTAGAVTDVDRYHHMPTSGDGTRYTNYYRSTTEYDSMGRVEYTISDVSDESTYDREQVTRHYYDFLGRNIKSSEGVSDNSHDIGGGKPTLYTLAETFYDDPNGDGTPEQGVGDGNVSWTRAYFGTGGSDYNNTKYLHDWRNRRCLTIPPAGPVSLVLYDNLDRVSKSGTYSTATNLAVGDDPGTEDDGNRLSFSKTYFDEWGRVYKTESFDDPTGSPPADALVSNTYYDRRGMVWATDPPNSGVSFTKYDGAGRRTETMRGIQFDSAKYTSNVPDYPDDNEGLFQRSVYTLNDDGNATQISSDELLHDDAAGLCVYGVCFGDDYVRSYVYHWYDTAHRLTDSASYGTNHATTWRNGSAPSYGGSAPSRSDTVLVTTHTFDVEGRQEKTTDAKAIEPLNVYDRLGRTIAKVENNGGLNRKTEYQYNAAGSLVRIIHDPGADNTFADGVWTLVGGDVDQVTEYAYTDGQNARRVKEIRYPTGDGTVGSSSTDKIVFTYNVDGTLNTRTDQNGTVLTWSYDTLRRKTEEEVTTLGSYSGGATAVDGTVRAVTWTYDSEGRVALLSTHTDTTPDVSTWTDAKNQIQYTYNAAGRLTKEEVSVRPSTSSI